METTVTIVDYGVGNLLSVSRAFSHCGAEAVLSDSPTVIKYAERLVLPGVGAFADGMAGLQQRELIQPIKEYAHSGRPLLGICLGMQMLLEVSEEFGTHPGLGLIPGTVVAIPKIGSNGQPHKIPHIGWNGLLKPAHQPDWQHTLLEGVMIGEATYFVHSFTAMPTEAQHRLADCNYQGLTVSAVIRAGNIYGCQFHPEKSGLVGLRIIKNFLTL